MSLYKVIESDFVCVMNVLKREMGEMELFSSITPYFRNISSGEPDMTSAPGLSGSSIPALYPKASAQGPESNALGYSLLFVKFILYVDGLYRVLPVIAVFQKDFARCA
jgi:hypothetical protein